MPVGTDRRDEAKVQGRLWTPQADRARMLAWHAMDVAEGSAITYSTGISNLKDLSGNGRDGTQATGAAQPTLSDSGPRRLAAFTSAQSLQVLSSSDAATYLTVASAWSFWALIERQGTATFPAAYGTDNGGIQSARQIYYDSSASYRISFGANGTGINGTVNAGIGEQHLALVTNTTAGVTTLRTDGAQSGLDTPGMSLVPSTAFSVNGKSANLIAMNFYEGGIFSATLSTAECERLEGYACWKWNLVSLLPAAHRYKNRPPLIGD